MITFGPSSISFTPEMRVIHESVGPQMDLRNTALFRFCIAAEKLGFHLQCSYSVHGGLSICFPTFPPLYALAITFDGKLERRRAHRRAEDRSEDADFRPRGPLVTLDDRHLAARLRQKSVDWWAQGKVYGCDKSGWDGYERRRCDRRVFANSAICWQTLPRDRPVVMQINTLDLAMRDEGRP